MSDATASRGSRSVASIRSRRPARPAVGKLAAVLRGSATPSARSRPLPPSVVAEPPSPIVMRSTPASSAADEVAGPARGCRPGAVGRPLLGREPGEPRGGGHLDERASTLVEQQPIGGDRPARGVGRGDGSPLGGLAERVGHRGQGALAAVGHRPADDLVVGRTLDQPWAMARRPPPSPGRRRTSRARRGRGAIGPAWPVDDTGRCGTGEAPAVGPHRRGRGQGLPAARPRRTRSADRATAAQAPTITIRATARSSIARSRRRRAATRAVGAGSTAIATGRRRLEHAVDDPHLPVTGRRERHGGEPLAVTDARGGYGDDFVGPGQPRRQLDAAVVDRRHAVLEQEETQLALLARGRRCVRAVDDRRLGIVAGRDRASREGRRGPPSRPWRGRVG